MKNTLKKVMGTVMVVALLVGVLTVPSQSAQAASKKVGIAKKAKVTVGKTVKIKLKNNKKKVTWKVTKGKKLIKITKKTKAYAKVKGIKKGTAKVQAIVGKKKYTCTVKVSAAKKKSTSTSMPQVSKIPTGNSVTPSPVPEETNAPNADLTISSARELNEFAQKVNSGNNYSGKLIQLTSDIKYDGVTINNFTPIAHEEGRGFQGTFDGCGHMISGIDVTDTTEKYDYGVALFGVIGASGVIKNVIVSNSSFVGNGSYGGCIAVYNLGGMINNCYTYDVNAYAGISRYNSGIIMNCSSENNITSSGRAVGGIAGINSEKGEILNCCNLGDIHSTQEDTVSIGGICGENYGTVQNCYNIGVIDSKMTEGKYVYIGGITGQNDTTAIVANCYCSEESAMTNFGNMLGIEKNCMAYPSNDMQTETFVNLLNANRGSNIEWQTWQVQIGSDVLYPMPCTDAFSNVLGTTDPTVSPSATPYPDNVIVYDGIHDGEIFYANALGSLFQ